MTSYWIAVPLKPSLRMPFHYSSHSVLKDLRFEADEEDRVELKSNSAKDCSWIDGELKVPASTYYQ